MRTFTLAAAALILGGCGSTSGGIPIPGPNPDVVIVGDEDRDRDDDDRRSPARGPRALNGVPPGHYPPPGECRVWVPGRPPGHQAPPARCESLVGRVPRGAFLLYNDKAWDRDYDWARAERERPGSIPEIVLRLLAATR